MSGWSVIAFSAPWVLWGLLLLPLLWILLRALPPAPVQQLFPAVGLLKDPVRLSAFDRECAFLEGNTGGTYSTSRLARLHTD